MAIDIAQWRSVSGKHWVTLRRGNVYANGIDYHYVSPSAGGSANCYRSGALARNDDEAIAFMQARIDRFGGFQPDANKTPMKMTRFPVI